MFNELHGIRQTLLAALASLSRTPEQALGVLGLSPRQLAELDNNTCLATAPTTPALGRYTGVLYDTLDAPSLSPAARRRANAHLLICSALFGAVRPDDPIPAYRLSGATTLPGLGTLASIWKPVLSDVLHGDEPIIDLRSGPYVALAPIPDAVTVRVVDADGRSISHHNKAAKGRLVRAYLCAPREPKTVQALVRAGVTAGLAITHVGDGSLQIRV